MLIKIMKKILKRRCNLLAEGTYQSERPKIETLNTKRLTP